jgi:hypothetical protein
MTKQKLVKQRRAPVAPIRSLQPRDLERVTAGHKPFVVTTETDTSTPIT